MQTVAIIGAGDVGALTARTLASRESVGLIRLIDEAEGVAAGKALDIQQSNPIAGCDVRLAGSTRLDDAASADIVVIADTAAGAEWRGDAGLELVRRVAAVATRAPFVFAGAAQRELMLLASHELRLPAPRLVGTAPAALGSAARAMVAVAADCSARDVSLLVLGVPGSWVTAWSGASIAGVPATAALPAHVLARVERQVSASWPPGPYALGSAAAAGVTALVRRSRRHLTAFASLDGQFLTRNVVAAVPVTLGATGIRALHAPSLDTRERVCLETALLR